MVKNKLFIFMISALIILSIGVVSAQEVSSNATDTQETIVGTYDDLSTEVTISTYDENISSYAECNDNSQGENNVGTSIDSNNGYDSNEPNRLTDEESTDTSFTKLNELIVSANGTLILNSSYKMTSNDSKSFEGGINISKNICIDGNGFTIDANKLGRIFNVFEGVELNLTNVVLVNSLVICHSTPVMVFNGRAAIDNNWGSVNVNNCTFMNNYGNLRSVISNSGTFTANNCRFINNQGVVHCDYNSKAYMTSCSFINNNEYNTALISNFGVVTVCDSNFFNNTDSKPVIWNKGYVVANNNWWGDNNPNWENLFYTFEADLSQLIVCDSYVVLNLTVDDGVVCLDFHTNDTFDDVDISGIDVKLTMDENKVITGKIVNGKFNTTYDPTRVYLLTVEVDNEKFNVVTPIYVDPINGDDENDGFGWETPFKTIEHALAIAPYGGKIYLADGAYFWENQIEVNNTVTIIGNGTNTLITNNAGFISAVFKINADNVAIYNVTFVNNSANSGGAIFVAGSNFTVSGCSFINNTAESGGAIFVAGSNFTVNNCSFINNTAGNRGGAIYDTCDKSGLTVSNSSFFKNSASEGNAIYSNSNVVANDNWWGDNNPKWETLLYNTSVVPNTYAVLNLTINNTIVCVNFYRNNTDTVLSIFRDFKLAIGDRNNNNKIVDGTFEQEYDVPDGNYAITVYVDNEKQSISFIHDVYVDVMHGKDYNEGSSWDKSVQSLYKAMELVSPKGKIYLGDGIHYDLIKRVVDKTVSIIGNGTNTVINYDLKGMGVFEITVDNVAIYNLTFVYNVGSNGGVIYNFGSNFTISGCNFSNNTASDGGGGVIYNYECSGFNISNCNFINNTAIDGGVICNFEASGVVSNCNFINNTVDVGGGVIYNSKYSNFNITNCNFINNAGSYFGGAISNYGHGIASGCTFVNNSAGDSGGAIYSIGDFTVSGCTFVNSSADMGGVVYNGGDFTVSDCSFVNSSADMGGVVYNFECSAFNMDNCTFISNVASRGSAIYNSGDSGFNFDVTNCSFINNAVNDSGIVYNLAFNFTLINCSFINNTVNRTGVVYNVASNFTVINCSFSNNSANMAGAIYNSISNFTLSGCNFINNSAIDGGAVYNSGSNFNVTNCRFSKGFSNNGGAVYNIGSNFTVNNCSFANNNAYNGGAVYNLGVDCTINNSKFEDNDGLKGVAIYNGVRIVNIGTINLNNNTYSGVGEDKTYIYNSAIIYTPVIITVLGNKTVNCKYGDEVTLFASITTDDGASVAGGILNFIICSEQIKAISNDNGIYNQTYKIPFENTYEVVSASYNNEGNVSVLTGILDVRGVPSVNISVDDVEYGKDLVINGNITKNVTGEVIISLDDWKKYTTNIVDGKFNYSIKDLINGGSHKITVKYGGNDNYKSVEVNKTVNVTRATANLEVSIANGDYGEMLNITATLTGVNNTQLYGTVVVKINNKTYNLIVDNGKGIFKDIALPAGDYNFTATWGGTNNYNPAQDTGSFKIAKIDPTIDVSSTDIYVGEDAIIEVILPENATGEVVITVDDVNYTVKVENGTAKQNITGLKTMDETSLIYLVHVKYLGDNNYNNLTALDDEFTVYKVSNYDLNVTIPSDTKYGENTTITVCVPSDATGNITVSVDGKNYTVKIENGTAKTTISPLSLGQHNITTTYNGDDKYLPNSVNKTLDVIPADVNLTADDVVMIYKDGSSLYAVLLDAYGNPIVNTTISFTINCVTYTRTTDANGTASIAINLDYGVYSVVVSYAGNATYNPASVNATVTVNSSIIGSDIVKIYQNDTQFYGTFVDSNGKYLANTNVIFNINGVFYTRQTDANGTAKLNINLDSGSYTLTAYNPINGEQRGFNVLVKSLIETKDLTKYYINGSKFEAKVYNCDGSLAANKNVTFNINGVFYTRTADANGIVKLAITLRPGDYIITSMYEGLSIGNKVKVLPTLETSDLVMKYQDGSTFKVKTLDGQGNPLSNQNLTFNVNGVFYHKTTNNDGIAELNINLMKGEYIITSYWNDYETGNKISIS